MPDAELTLLSCGVTKRFHDSIVTLLVDTKNEWPKWIQIVATSRPDSVVRAELKPLDHASIDVLREENKTDLRTFVLLRIQKNKCNFNTHNKPT